MDNKKVVQTYIEGFNTGDHAKILSCLTDNIIWEMHGLFHLEGKEQFDAEIENDAFEGLPAVTITRLIEEDQIVVAEGNVKSKMKNGDLLDAMFCDVFHFDKGKIKQLTGYIMPKIVTQSESAGS
jgi:ketosteroid isomerase-like protein